MISLPPEVRVGFRWGVIFLQEYSRNREPHVVRNVELKLTSVVHNQSKWESGLQSGVSLPYCDIYIYIYICTYRLRVCVGASYEPVAQCRTFRVVYT